MPNTEYQRTDEELRKHASMFWPKELSIQEADLSVIPKLIATQDDFIAILSIKVPDLDRLFQIVKASAMPANLFVKHLAVLANFGGEPIDRVNDQFHRLFPSGELNYLWNGEQRTYKFRSFPIMNRNDKSKPAKLDNDRLRISSSQLLKPRALSDLLKDVIVLILVGGASVSEEAARVLARCEISEYLGEPEKLAKFIKQRYIWVSSIIGGAKANTLGQIAQDFVKEYLEEHLNLTGLSIIREGKLPDVTHTDPQTGQLTTFDLVISHKGKHAAVEVCFQETTNSTIERKGGQAHARYEQIKAAQHKIAYVVDGAGNFQRKSFLRNICSNSDCTVAFSPTELEVLCKFLREYFEKED